MEILVATRNAGKMREFNHLLAPLQATLRFPPEIGLEIEVVEDGDTYEENARKKALTYARASGLLVLADDSGLEVDGLDGAPGVRSARYAPGHDMDRVEALLAHLINIPWEKRTARFRCVVVAIAPGEETCSAEGVCEGVIAFEPVGQGGFGYDPVFFMPDHGCTMAQLPGDIKNRISHRARAVNAAMPALCSMLPGG